MKVAVRGNKVDLDEKVEAYVEKKMAPLNRVLPSILETKVEISREKAKSPQNRYVVQMTVNSNGTLIRAEEKEADLYAAIDAAADVMRRQARRFKDRFYLKHRRTARHKREVPPTLAPSEVSVMTGKVVRTKRFPLRLMTIQEAAEQMELLGHDFFVFLNTTSGTMNILYRRQDGNYGIIQPQIP